MHKFSYFSAIFLLREMIENRKIRSFEQVVSNHEAEDVLLVKMRTPSLLKEAKEIDPLMKLWH